jgi:hypothetical protein
MVTDIVIHAEEKANHSKVLKIPQYNGFTHWAETVNRKKAQNRPFLHGPALPSPRSAMTFFLLRTTHSLNIFEMFFLFFHLSRSFLRNRHVHFWAQSDKTPSTAPPPVLSTRGRSSKSKKNISWLIRLLHICERKQG